MALTPSGGGAGGSTMASGSGRLGDIAGRAFGGGFGPSAAPEEDAPSPLVDRWSRYFNQSNIPQSRITGPGRANRPFFGGLGAPHDGAPMKKRNTGPRATPITGAMIDGYSRTVAKKDTDRSRLHELVSRILGAEATPEEIANEWGWAIAQIEMAEGLGMEAKDPWHWLEQKAATIEAERAEKEGPKGPRTITQTQRTLNLTDPTTAGVLLRRGYQSYTGKRMSDEDVAAAVAALNAQEQANPTITKTTSVIDDEAGTQDSTTETTGGGTEPGAFMEKWLDDNFNTEADVYRAGTQYADVASALVGGLI